MTRNLLTTAAVAGVLLSAGGLAKAEDVATKMTDEHITAQVKEKLAADEPNVAPRIMVSTRDGVVTLLGRELDPGQIETAMHDANDTDGVVRVENHLKMG